MKQKLIRAFAAALEVSARMRARAWEPIYDPIRKERSRIYLERSAKLQAFWREQAGMTLGQARFKGLADWEGNPVDRSMPRPRL